MTSRNRVLLQPVGELIAGQTRSTVSTVRPAVIRRTARTASAKPAVKQAWITPVSESTVEKLLYAVLALSAAAGIAYAVLGVVEHAQNWPVFNAWVGRILGA